jgi:hypothetical protein
MDTELEYKTLFKSEKSKRGNKGKEEESRKEFIIELPKLDLTCVNTKNEKDKYKIVITPNSINGEFRDTTKFIIGREDKKMNNDFSFRDEIGNKQFEINYDKMTEKYSIIDTKMGTGLFVKIQTKLQIKQDTIVSFCQTHMIIQLDPKSSFINIDKKSVKIKFLQGPYTNKEFIFQSNIKDLIRIGRSRNAEIVYKDDSVSRVQCSLAYESDSWFVYDGLPNEGNKNSTNGLW